MNCVFFCVTGKTLKGNLEGERIEGNLTVDYLKSLAASKQKASHKNNVFAATNFENCRFTPLIWVIEDLYYEIPKNPGIYDILLGLNHFFLGGRGYCASEYPNFPKNQTPFNFHKTRSNREIHYFLKMHTDIGIVLSFYDQAGGIILC